MRVHISDRLRSIALLVPPHTKLVDIGTDHALLPIWLVQQGRISSCIASDIRRGPLLNAERLVRETGTDRQISLRLADGLDGLTREDADTVVIAGMGGEEISSIVLRADWIRDGVFLILSPHTKPESLRRSLSESGIRILSEQLVEERGRLYPIMTAGAGEPKRYAAAEYYVGKYEDLSSDPLFFKQLTRYIRRFEKAAPYDSDAAAAMRECILMKERLESDDDCRRDPGYA